MPVNSQVHHDIRVQFSKMHAKGEIKSIGTANSYTNALITFVDYIADNVFLIDCTNDHHLSLNYLINHIDRELAISFLNQLAINKKSLKWQNMARSAINHWLKYTLNLIKNGKSKVFSNKKKQLKKIIHRYVQIKPKDISPCEPTKHFTKSYTKKQVELLLKYSNENHYLSILLCSELGLRAHELLSIKPIELQKPKIKDLSSKQVEAQKYKFFDPNRPNELNGKLYSVKGKGGLIRAIFIRDELVTLLEAKKLKKPKLVKDRTVLYFSDYDLTGGNTLSVYFTRLSQKLFSWSTGIHSFRHDYAKSRLKILYNHFSNYELARLIVSQELGHFRPQITNSYLY